LNEPRWLRYPCRQTSSCSPRAIWYCCSSRRRAACLSPTVSLRFPRSHEYTTYPSSAACQSSPPSPETCDRRTRVRLSFSYGQLSCTDAHMLSPVPSSCARIRRFGGLRMLRWGLHTIAIEEERLKHHQQCFSEYSSRRQLTSNLSTNASIAVLSPVKYCGCSEPPKIPILRTFCQEDRQGKDGNSGRIRFVRVCRARLVGVAFEQC